jgi:hypothetical protein
MNSKEEQKHIDMGHCKIIDVSQIEPSPLNVRLLEDFHESEQADEFIELCNSIRKEGGLIQPIIVRKVNGKYEAIAGSRRLHALKYIGIKEAPTIVREMEDNDVRIASLVENIHRENIDSDAKEKSLKDIYANANPAWKNTKLVEKYLSNLQRRRLSKRHGRDISTNFNIPREFEELVDRIGWAPGYQYQIIRGIDIRPYAETNFVDSKELDSDNREVLDRYRFREDLEQKIADEISGITKTKALKTIQQYAHDIATGAIREDQETGEYRYFPSKAEDISNIDTETTGAAAREEITKVGRVLFKLITGSDLHMSDVRVAEKQAQSKYSIDHMKEICTHDVQKRELRVLQDVVIPLEIALTKLMDEIEAAGK